MKTTTLLFIAIFLLNGFYAFSFIRDLLKNKEALKKERGSAPLLTFSSFLLFFLSALGISDFALSTVFYRFKKLVKDDNLPGTLNTQCVIPVAVMAFAFISVIEVEMKTLFFLIMAQMVGAYLGPKLVVKLPRNAIRIFIGIGLLLSTFFILASKFDFIPSSGHATGLHGMKLLIGSLLLFIFGILNNLGIGSYPLTMITVYSLGLSPVISFPIMMGASAFSVPLGSLQFIKYGRYSRKITLFTSTVGVIGALVGIFLVKKLDVSIIEWGIIVILFYSGLDLLKNEIKNMKSIANKQEKDHEQNSGYQSA